MAIADEVDALKGRATDGAVLPSRGGGGTGPAWSHHPKNVAPAFFPLMSGQHWIADLLVAP